MKKIKLDLCLLTILTGIILIYCSPYLYGEKIPGENHDARITLFVLENFFLGIKRFSGFLDGQFAPWPYTILLSEPLWGSAPIYSFPRLFGISKYASYEIWFVVGYLINAFSAYIAIRCLKFGWAAALVGALTFAISLPVTAQDGHGALLYRFLVPITFLILLYSANISSLLRLSVAALLISIQLLFSLYIGFFLAIAIIPAAIFTLRSNKLILNRNDIIYVIILLVGALLLASLTMLPSKFAQSLYSVAPNYDEIKLLTPNFQSLFFADRALLFKLSEFFNSQKYPLPWEKQLFIGVTSAIVLAYSVFYRPKSQICKISLVTILFLMIIFIGVYGVSVYSAIISNLNIFLPRASGRFILVALFPLALVIASFIEKLNNNIFTRINFYAILLIYLSLFLLENIYVYRLVASENDWRSRESSIVNNIGQIVRNDDILSISTQLTGWDNNNLQIDAMLAAQSLGIRTLNGVSSVQPPSWAAPNNCALLLNDHLAYNKFASQKGFPLLKDEAKYILLSKDDCYLKDVISGINLTGEVRFKNVYLLNTLAPQEDFGRWQLNNRLEYKFVSNHKKILHISIVAKPSPSPDAQSLTVEIGNSKAVSSMSKGMKRYDFYLNVDNISSDDLTLYVYTSKPVRPSDLLLNADDRILGFGLSSIQITSL